MYKPSEVLLHFQWAQSGRVTWDSRWEEVARLCEPNSIHFLIRDWTPGTDFTQYQYDSTAQISCKDWVSLHSGLGASQTSEWFDFTLADEEPTEETLDNFAQIKKSLRYHAENDGFYNAASEVYNSLGHYGNSAMLIEERPITRGGFQGFRFLTFPLNEVYFVEDGNGDVTTMFRHCKMTAYQAVTMFGEGANLTSQIKEAYNRCDTSTKWSFINKICPVDPEMPKGRYESYWITEHEPVVVKHGFYEEKPFVGPRLRVTASETYGRGISVDMIAEIRTLNHMAKRHLQAADFSVLPPVAYNEGMDIDLKNRRPGRFYAVTDINGMKPELNKYDERLFTSRYEKSAQAVERAFYVDAIRLSSGQGADNKDAYMKATVAQMLMEKNRMTLGPIVTRMNREFYKPVVERMLMIYLRAMRGKIQFSDQIQRLAKNGSLATQIDIVGPLAMAQKQVELQALGTYLQYAGGIGGISPSSLDYFDADEAQKMVAGSTGLTRKLIRKTTKVADIRNTRAQIQNQQAQAQLMQTASEANKNNAQAQSMGQQQ